jgi:nucleotide-binding universal stress UspA family protein
LKELGHIEIGGMLHVQLLGIGCRKSRALKNNLLDALKPLRLDVRLKEVTDVDAMLRYGITGAPALVVNGRVVYQGTVPDIEELTSLFKPYMSSHMSSYTIRNIVVPTDFSAPSANAFRYAKALAQEMQANIQVIHIYHPEHDPANPFPMETLKEIESRKRKMLSDFVEELSAEEPFLPESSVSMDVRVGFASEELVQLSRQPDHDLIVMGTTGDGGVLGKVFGSVSTDVASQGECPVMFIPGGARYSHLQDVLYASTGEQAETPCILRTLDFIRPMGVRLHVVHVKTSAKSVYSTDRIAQIIGEYAPAQSSECVVLEHGEVAEALQLYAAQHDIGMVVASTQHRGFFEKLFHHSVSRELLLQADLPFLLLYSDQ